MRLIEEELIEINASLKTKEKVIEKFCDLLFEKGRVTEKEGFVEDVFTRENEMSTSMGLGIAIPHAQSNYVKYPSLVFIKLDEPITWKDDSNVEMIFGIAVPKESGSKDHLRILSTLARKLMDTDFREELSNITSKQEGQKVLNFLD